MRSLIVLAMAAPLIACSGGSSSTASAEQPDAAPAAADGSPEPSASDSALPAADGAVGVGGIYKSCPPVTLTQSYTDPDDGFSVGYPASWSGASVASNSYALSASYSYVPTGASTSMAAVAQVTTLTGKTALDMADVQRMLNDMVSGFPSAVVRRFTLGGEPAIAWWYDTPPAQAGCSACQPDPGPDFIVIGVGTAKGLSVFQLGGSARVDAPDPIFCDIQAIEASLSP
jgi:hypothetical protein